MSASGLVTHPEPRTPRGSEAHLSLVSQGAARDSPWSFGFYTWGRSPYLRTPPSRGTQSQPSNLSSTLFWIFTLETVFLLISRSLSEGLLIPAGGGTAPQIPFDSLGVSIALHKL